jgi:hypothetical protein
MNGFIIFLSILYIQLSVDKVNLKKKRRRFYSRNNKIQFEKKKEEQMFLYLFIFKKKLPNQYTFDLNFDHQSIL